MMQLILLPQRLKSWYRLAFVLALFLQSGRSLAQAVFDDCTGAINMIVQPGSVCAALYQADNTGATASVGLPDPGCANYQGADIWFKVTVPATGNVTVQTVTPNGISPVTDTGMGIYYGTCSNLTEIGCDDNSGGNLKSLLSLSGRTPGEMLYIRVWANGGTATGPIAVCATSLTAPINDECAGAITVPITPTCTTVTSGSIAGATQSLAPSASCRISAITADDVWYQFVATGTTQLITLNSQFTSVFEVRSGTCANSTSISCTTLFPNTTSGTVVGSLTIGQTYFIRVFANSAVQPPTGFTAFTLCINPGPPPPANDECIAAVGLTTGPVCTPTSGTVQGATQSVPPSSSCNNGATTDVWYSFVATAVNQTFYLQPNFFAVLDIRSGTCASSSSITCTTIAPNNTTPWTLGGFTIGRSYFIRIYLATPVIPIGQLAAFTICVTPTIVSPINDDCAGAIDVPVQVGSTCTTPAISSNANATASPGVSIPSCNSGYNGGDIWFKATVPASGTLTAQTVIAPSLDIHDTGMTVYAGTCGSLTEIGCNDDIGASSLKSLVTLNGRTPGEVVYIRVWAYGNSAVGNLAVCVTTPSSCPVPFNVVTANVMANSADVGWVPGGTPPPGTTYTVEFGPQGFVLGTGTALSGITISNTHLSTLQPGTAYCYYVRQDCPGTIGSSAYVGPLCFTTLGTPLCAMPTNLSVTNLTATAATPNWQAGGTPIPGTTYTLEYGPQGFTPGTGTTISRIGSLSFTLTSLIPSTTYCFYVRQNCPGTTGNSSDAGPFCFTTTSSSVTCPVPSALTTTAITTSSATLSWLPGGTPVPGTTYTVIYGLQGFNPSSGGTTFSNFPSPNLNLANLTPGTVYCFYVRQVCPNGVGSSALVGPSCFTTPTTTGIPVNDEPCGATTLPLTNINQPLQPINGSNVLATTSTHPGITLPACSPTTTPLDVWFSFVPASGYVIFTLSGSPASMVRAYTAPSCSTGPFTLVACQSSGASNTGLTSFTLQQVTPGQQYYLAISGYDAASIPGTFIIAGLNAVLATRPSIETDALQVFPNPSNTGQVVLRLKTTSLGGEATLFNAIGQVMLHSELPLGSTEQTLKTQGLAPGLYTLRVVLGGQVYTRKVVLE